ncbi:MAG TPA: phosphoribosyl-ATP diphosphatase [Planctomycetaceae bacterium]|nr:phosphoribosyl-ATP diphosphatase [Planctomycetaceae bacterium]
MSDATTGSVVARLMAVIEHRRRERPGGSYTVELLDGGPAVLSAKVIEEAYELIGAAAESTDDVPSRMAITHEAADVIFHLLVFLAANDIAWQDVERELEQRFGVSGLTEKAHRQQGEAS